MATYVVHKRRKKDNFWGVLLASPPLIGMFLFTVIPLAFSVVISFSDMHSFNLAKMEFLGFGNLFGNYADVIRNDLFWRSMANTFIAALSLPISIGISLFLAQLLNQSLKVKKVFRTLYFLPFVCSIIALAYMWRMLLDTNYGVINKLLEVFGVSKVNWLGDESYFLPAMVLMGVWQSIGFNFILLSAALTNVNPSYYEAAKVDGANAWVRFFRITVPAITPTLFYLVVVGLIGALQEFARFQVMATDATMNRGLTMVYLLYRMGFEQVTTYGLGMSAAMAWLLTILIALVTFINFKVSKKWVSYD